MEEQPPPLPPSSSSVQFDLDEENQDVKSPARRLLTLTEKKVSRYLREYDLLSYLASTRDVSSLAEIDKRCFVELFITFFFPLNLLRVHTIVNDRSVAYAVMTYIMCLIIYPILIAMIILSGYYSIVSTGDRSSLGRDELVLGELVLPCYSYFLAALTASLFAANVCADEEKLYSEIFGFSGRNRSFS